MTDDATERLRRLVAGGEPTELIDSYFATAGDGVSRAVGTSVPLLGLTYETTDSGLLVPEGLARPTILNMARRFITAAEIIDEPVTPDMVAELVTRHSCEVSVAAGAVLMGELFEEHPNNPERQLRLATRFTYGDTQAKARALVEDGWVFLAPQAVLAAMKLAFLLPPRETGDPERALGHIVAASLGIAQFLGTSADADEPWRDGMPASIALEVVQNQHFNAHTNIGAAMGRFRRLREIEAEQFGVSTERIDRYFEEVTGCTIDTLFDVGMVAWANSASNHNVRISREAFSQLDYADDAVEAALKVLAADEDLLRSLIADENERVGFDWTFNQFRRYPLLKAKDGDYILMHQGFLVERFCGSAAFWEVRSRLPRPGSKASSSMKTLAGTFDNHHGHVPEAYVGESLRAILGPMAPVGPELIDEATLKERWPGQSVCDFVIDFGTTVVLIEVVNHRLKESTVAGGSVEALDEDLDIIVGHEATQIQSVIELMLHDPEYSDREIPPVFYPIVVATAGFPWGPVTARAAWHALAEGQLLQQGRTRPLQVFDLPDLEIIESAVARRDLSLLSILEQRFERNQEDLPLDVWMSVLGLPLERPPRLNSPIERAFRQLAKRLGQDPDDLSFPDGNSPPAR